MVSRTFGWTYRLLGVPYIYHSEEEVKVRVVKEKQEVNPHEQEDELNFPSSSSSSSSTTMNNNNDENENDDDENDNHDREQQHDDRSSSSSTTATVYRDVFHCALCGTGKLNSTKVCELHCQSRGHLKRYEKLQSQRNVWLLEEIAIQRSKNNHQNLLQQNRHNKNINKNKNESSSIVVDDQLFEFHTLDLTLEEIEEGDDMMPQYIVPIRRWHWKGWISGWTCQLCGTRDMPNRTAVVYHCQSSQQHQIHREGTIWKSYDRGCKMTGEYHSEVVRLLRHIQRIVTIPRVVHMIRQPKPPIPPGQDAWLLPPIDVWRMECLIKHYISAKEYVIDGLASQRYEWHTVLDKYQFYQRRYILSLLELTVWKQHMLTSYYHHDPQQQQIKKKDEGEEEEEEENEDMMLQSRSTTTTSHGRQTFQSLSELYHRIEQQQQQNWKKDSGDDPLLEKVTNCVEAYKQQCRFTSGITVIMEGVVPFLYTSKKRVT